MNNWGYFIMGVGLGFVFIKYNKWLVDNVGRSQFAERYLGAGGTYSMWKLGGIAAIMFGIWALFNWE
ncbi:MAG: hypothetical protein WCO23_01625 [bacterium]